MSNFYSNLYNDFYKLVNNIIIDIHNNTIINKLLHHCKYYNIVTKQQIYYPLTIILGGSGYIMYKNIFEHEGLVIHDINLDTYDYDITFSLINKIDNKTIKIIINIIDSLIKTYIYENITYKNFEIENVPDLQRLHIRINFKDENKSFHILELSFWYNNKVSDNFTINDFTTRKLILYENNDVYYYLLPLELLVKTTLYAVIDYFEKRNFNKCIKYLDRIKFIKKCNHMISKFESNNILYSIFEKYKNNIKRKYKLIHDYPFILSYKLVEIKNNGIIKCIYRKLRTYNYKIINDLIKKYKEKCKKMKPYNNQLSEDTIINTEEIIIDSE
jgi:hypothetical protein